MQARSPLGDVESAKLVGLPHRIAEFDANGWIMAEGDRVTHCHLLCEIAARQEDAGICQGPDYEWPMTQEQIGDATGLTSVHVNRTLQQLRSFCETILRGRCSFCSGAGRYSRSARLIAL